MSSALSVLPVRDPETGVPATRTRRRFSTAQKLQLLAAAEACTKPGELGALLRRVGLLGCQGDARRISISVTSPVLSQNVPKA
jgi:hypothetical protein